MHKRKSTPLKPPIFVVLSYFNSFYSSPGFSESGPIKNVRELTQTKAGLTCGKKNWVTDMEAKLEEYKTNTSAALHPLQYIVASLNERIIKYA